jgi:hypothetical protein
VSANEAQIGNAHEAVNSRIERKLRFFVMAPVGDGEAQGLPSAALSLNY